MGSARPAERAEIIDSVRSREIRVVMATKIADEGLDIPCLDTLVLATPAGSKSAVEQRIGRMMRPSVGKKPPVIFDIRDSVPFFRGGARRRDSLSRKLGIRPTASDYPAHAFEWVEEAFKK